MIWLILGAALLVAVVTFAVLRLRHAQATLNTIMAEHRDRTANTKRGPTPEKGSHHRPGRRNTNRADGSYDRRMSA